MAKNDLGLLLLGLGFLYFIKKPSARAQKPFEYGGETWMPSRLGGTSYTYYTTYNIESEAQTEVKAEEESANGKDARKRPRKRIPVAPMTKPHIMAGLEHQMKMGAQYR